MSVQVIMREGQPEYAVLPWDQYQALLTAAGQLSNSPETVVSKQAQSNDEVQPLSQLTVIREAKGLSQADLARTVGISPHYLAMIESGERIPDQAILRSLAHVLEVTKWELNV